MGHLKLTVSRYDTPDQLSVQVDRTSTDRQFCKENIVDLSVHAERKLFYRVII